MIFNKELIRYIYIAVIFSLLGFLVSFSYLPSKIQKENEMKLEEFKRYIKDVYQSEYTEKIKLIEQDYTTKLSKLTETEKTTVTKKDGTTTVVEKVKIKEENVSKVNQNVIEKQKSESIQDSKETEISKIEKNEKNKQVIENRKYLVYVSYLTIGKDIEYNAGFLYNLGFVNFGLSTSSNLKDKFLIGPSIGVSF